MKTVTLHKCHVSFANPGTSCILQVRKAKALVVAMKPRHTNPLDHPQVPSARLAWPPLRAGFRSKSLALGRIIWNPYQLVWFIRFPHQACKSYMHSKVGSKRQISLSQEPEGAADEGF